MDEEDNKLTLKRVELSLSKFNEIAIPHHLDLLRQHKANILQYERAGSVKRAGAEAVRASRVASQLRSLLAELGLLRAQLVPADRSRFDALTQRSRDLTMSAIAEYLDENGAMIPMKRVGREEVVSAVGSVVSTDSVGVVLVVRDEEEDQKEQMMWEVERQEASARALRSLRELEEELGALTDAWKVLGAHAHNQREPVVAVADSVDVAADNANEGRVTLSSAERLRWRAVRWGLGGAAVGALVGGPVGLVLGLKAGAIAALAGFMLGFLGMRRLSTRSFVQTTSDVCDISVPRLC